jgi:hypothetical protein
MDLPDWDQSKPDPGHYPAILRPFAQRPLWLDSSPPRPIVAVHGPKGTGATELG